MSNLKNTRDYEAPIHWEGDLEDDCMANWSGLILCAELMDDNRWWWSVYDKKRNEEQIDSSNNYDESFDSGDNARGKAEETARNYLKDELVKNIKGLSEKFEAQDFILELKKIGISPMQTIHSLANDFNFAFGEAKDLVFNSPHWKGLREQSDMLMQLFLDVNAEDADKVEIVDGRVVSITFDLTKDDSTKKPSIWNRLIGNRNKNKK